MNVKKKSNVSFSIPKMKNIVIVEDDSLVRSVLKFLLEGHGYKVHFAKDGNEGIELIDSMEPELLILDILMPYKTGLELAHYSKKLRPHIPILIISTLGNEDITIKEAAGLGVESLMSKPFMPADLLNKVRELIVKK